MLITVKHLNGCVNMDDVKKKQEEAKKQVYERLLLYRKAMGMTQKELADIVGVSRPNIARMESGDYNPTVDMLVKVADGLGLDVEINFKEKKEAEDGKV